MFKRQLKLALPAGQSAFLWGARNTGKSTFLKECYPDSIYYDLLKSDELTRLLTKPHLLREELSAVPADKLKHPVIIDEVQKVPALLDEIHWLIENKGISFILCGSSARKLKRSGANLLGGRSWPFTFYPLIYKEIPNFNLQRALSQGLIPTHYLTEHPQRMLRAYVTTYLKEEIQAEGYVRNLAGFARFLEVIGFTNGEMLNYSNVAQDCAIDAKTVREYYQILVDTLLGYLIFPFHKQVKRDLIRATPKFYCFDTGVNNYLSKTAVKTLDGPISGHAFEHFILMELKAFLGLNEIDEEIHYWRSKSGLEVDFVLKRGEIAIEVKLSKTPSLKDVRGLSVFCADYQPKHAIVVCQAPRKRRIKTTSGHPIDILPWQDFLENLWEGQYF